MVEGFKLHKDMTRCLTGGTERDPVSGGNAELEILAAVKKVFGVPEAGEKSLCSNSVKREDCFSII